MTAAYRIRLGSTNQHAEDCFRDGYIGVGYGFTQDFTGELVDDWRDFNKKFIPEYLAERPDKSKVAAGLACGTVWTVCKGIQIGDLVLSPTPDGHVRAGKVTGDYRHSPGHVLPQQRPVQWLDRQISRDEMSEDLQSSFNSRGTLVRLEKHLTEIERLLDGATAPMLTAADETIEDAAAFAMEKHLEEFLIENWQQTELGRDYDIYEVDGELVGQQFPTDTGAIDILALSKNKRTLLVVELKKGRASDAVVGQILRYMGYVQDELAEDGQAVKGIIIAMDDHQRIRRALAMTPQVEFYKYQVSFKLIRS